MAEAIREAYSDFQKQNEILGINNVYRPIIYKDQIIYKDNPKLDKIARSSDFISVNKEGTYIFNIKILGVNALKEGCEDPGKVKIENNRHNYGSVVHFIDNKDLASIYKISSLYAISADMNLRDRIEDGKLLLEAAEYVSKGTTYSEISDRYYQILKDYRKTIITIDNFPRIIVPSDHFKQITYYLDQLQESTREGKYDKEVVTKFASNLEKSLDKNITAFANNASESPTLQKACSSELKNIVDWID